VGRGGPVSELRHAGGWEAEKGVHRYEGGVGRQEGRWTEASLCESHRQHQVHAQWMRWIRDS
jgi:hypothetical protein